MPNTVASRRRPARQPAPVVRQTTPRWMWAMLMALIAVIAGGVGGQLAYASGASVPGAILTGFGSTATTLVSLVALAHFLTHSG